MFKSIFMKYFTVTAVIVSLTFILFAGAQSLLAGQYWVSEKKEILTDNATTIASFLTENTVEVTPDSYHIPHTLTPVLHRLATVADGNVLVTDAHFKIILCSETNGCHHVGQTLPSEVHSPLENHSLFTVGRLNDLYESSQYTVGIPLTVKENMVIGYVLVSSSAQTMRDYITDNLRVSLMTAVAILLLMFIVLYIMTYRMVNPLRKMATATRQFSRGDFSVRLRVKGQDEVAQLANALNGMALSLSSGEETRRNFVANVSHELKTPMTTISGFIDGILDGTIPPEKHNYYLEIVSSEIKRLSRLVKAMLDLSRLDSGQTQLRLTTFDITKPIGTALLSLEQQIEKKQLSITGLDECEPVQISGDYNLLQQVFYNLIENAVKFTDESGTVTIRYEHGNGRTRFTIRNSGDGIPATELPYIFDRFYKSDRSRGLDKTGTGLGLYLVKSIITLHGGEITVCSEDNEYCEFSFWLPDCR